jgi:cyclomaltodextrinase
MKNLKPDILFFWTFLIIMFLSGCSYFETKDELKIPEVSEDVLKSVPDWAKEAVWYQIFVERFRNGDARNQPELWGIEGSWPHDKPDTWAPTDWTQDWYKKEDWAIESGKHFYQTVQMRRYGGDLQGVLDKLDYLQDLGINAIYFNPLNDSPSLHKYDARSYHHIDIFFGPDPVGDLKIIQSENPNDPKSWKWTSADLLFLKVVEEAKKRDIRVIMDYSWNHTGITFWAWQDILTNQKDSEFADWYRIDSFEDPTLGTEFSYRGWAGVNELPEFKRHGEGADLPVIHSEPAPADLHPDLKRHIFAVTKRWMDPTGTGDISKGIDGFRLDVAELIPAKFWRDYRHFVRSINPDAYLVGELWWEKWPDKMMDPSPWLQGDIFDAGMNYRWYMPTRSYFGMAKPEILLPSEYVSHIDSISKGVPENVYYSQMNLTASHDSPRFMTSMLNKGQYKFQVNPRENPEYQLDAATDPKTLDRINLVLVKQFTDIGAPHIWMGDEMGMWGADDPDTRKPLIWSDLIFEDETYHPIKGKQNARKVEFDTNRFNLYKTLISIRKTHPVFVHGSKKYTLIDDNRNLLGFEREYLGDYAIVIFNNSNVDASVTYRMDNPTAAMNIKFKMIYSSHSSEFQQNEDSLRIELKPRSSVIMVSIKD